MELWAVVALSGLLLVLSIVGAFVGDQRAATLFNSWPLVAFWFLFAFLLIAGLLSFSQLRHRLGSLMMHLAALLVLGGAMWGSVKGHELANYLLGEKKVPAGHLQITKGETNNLISDGSGKVLGHLPFSLSLADFQIEYYPSAERDWLLVVELPQGPGGSGAMGDEEEGLVKQVRISWKIGEDVAVPETDLRLKVLQYLPAARPVYDEKAKPALDITTTLSKTAENKRAVLPAKAGEKIAIEEPKVEVEIVQVYANLMVHGMGEVVEAGGKPENPALKVQLTWPDGKKEIRYIMSRFPEHGQKEDGLHLGYTFPEPTAAEADPQSTTPAMEVLLSRGEKQQRQWLLPAENEPSAWLSLDSLLGVSDKSAAGTAGAAHPPMGAELGLIRPKGMEKSYISSVVVVTEGQPVARKDVKVNDPLHYGGYHFSQSNYGQDPATGTPYTVLSVTSDSGLLAVFAGFILLMAGAAWHCWVRPAWVFVTGRRAHGV
jgi:hypothetical protein